MKIKAQKTVQVDVKTISIHMKCRDEFEARIKDADGEVLKDYEGYVPGFMPGEHFGDYLILDIDIETGKITNWKAPTPAQIEEFLSPQRED